jgi:hypothetical protein
MGEDRFGGPFGFDPDDLREVVERIGRFVNAPGAGAGWSGIFQDWSRRPRSAPETTGETGDGVWAIYSVGDDGAARVDEVYATELDALRANKNNVDPKRKVRFLPYGIAVSVLDDSRQDPQDPEASA